MLSPAVSGGPPDERPEKWFREGRAAVERAKRLTPIEGRARNVILFVGDGMGVSTVTAARILEGQRRGEPGEENLLSFETLPYTALVKTYNTNQQTPCSAGTMTAIVTGVKTKAGVLSLDQTVTRGDHTQVAGHRLVTILELAEQAGLSTGVVTTTRLTHATPAACYAHAPERSWEDDGKLPVKVSAAGFPDIARQLIEFEHGDGLEVALGGGRRHFLPQHVQDPEYPELTGSRVGDRDLTAEWLTRPNAVYVWNKAQFDQVDVGTTDHLLGLFEPKHMHYEYDRSKDAAGEPSLREMTSKAIDLLARNRKGYFLMVEGGRIDLAHHKCNAYRALTDTIEFAEAVRVAINKVDRRQTLLIVTADHSHPFTIGGYAIRGNPILGTVVENDSRGNPRSAPARDAYGLPYTVLGYANGPRFYESPGRPDLTSVDTQAPDYHQEAAVPLASGDTHGGEDVAVYADGPCAHLFHGVLEQNVLFHVMADALGLAEGPISTDSGAGTGSKTP
jgi:alkaline phosphatase